MLTIIDPLNNQSFPSVVVGERKCFAIPYGRAFAVKVEPTFVHGRFEAVVSVDGRNALDNSPASPAALGVVTSQSYLCKGFQINSETVRQFVHMPSGEGLLTAERAGAPDALGMVAVAVYIEARSYMRSPSHLESFGGGHVMRGGGERTMRGGGAMAGAEVSASLGTTTWTRAGQPTIAVVEYDTYEGWAARGILIPKLSDANPWPGAAPRFAAASTL